MNPTPAGEPLQALFQAMKSLQRSFKVVGGRGFIIGGVAASLLGRPRMTRDVDGVVLLGETPVETYLKAASKEGIEPRIEGVIDFFQQSKVLLLRHVPSGVDIDVSAGLLQFEQEAFARSVLVRFGGQRFRLPAPEDLIILKAVACRPKDYEDIRGIMAAHPNLDRPWIERWIREFADLLETPEMWTDLQKVLDEDRQP
jgi:predicted nucleotidyltransferase